MIQPMPSECHTTRCDTMSQPLRCAPAANNEAQHELVILKAFDYTPLDADITQQVQTAAQRIRETLKRTLKHLLAVGKDLLAVKEALPHGHFGPWLRSEFGWTERTARNFMAVAERFGPKTEMISDLCIEPTAA